MDTEQQGANIAKQGIDLIMSQASKQEQQEKQAVANMKQYGQNKAFEKTAPLRSNALDKLISKMPQGMKKQFLALNKARAKAFTKIADKLSGFKIGGFQFGKMMAGPFAKGAKSAQAMVAKLEQSMAKTAASVGTKAASAVMATPTAGVSVGVQKAVEATKSVAETVAQTKATDILAKGKKPLMEVVQASPDKNAQKVDSLVNNKASELASKVVPHADKMKGVLDQSSKKADDKNKDITMAIFSGTKDLMSKTGITKDLGLTK